MKTAIFDLDGTLADTSGDLLAAANAQFEALGYGSPLTPADRNTALLCGRAMLSLRVERLGILDVHIDDCYQSLLDFYEANLSKQTRFYEGAVDCIKTLKADGWRIAICTNKPIHLAEKLIDELGASTLFEVIVGVNSIPERKPDPAPIYLVLEKLGALKEDAILVGDTSTDYNAARNSGIEILLVDFEETGIGQTHPDAMLARDFGDVLVQIKAWGNS